MYEIKCPKDLNQFLIGEPLFDNTFDGEECEKAKSYGDCYHCFATAIAKRDDSKRKKGHWINARVGKLFPSNDFKCSECGNILDFDGLNCGRGDANFCPNCGADMRG